MTSDRIVTNRELQLAIAISIVLICISITHLAFAEGVRISHTDRFDRYRSASVLPPAPVPPVP